MPLRRTLPCCRASRNSLNSTTDSPLLMQNCEIHILKHTSPLIYRGEMHFRVQKMGKLQAKNAITVRTKVRWRSECPSERIQRIRRGSARRSIRPPPNKSRYIFPMRTLCNYGADEIMLTKLAVLRYLGDAAA